MDATNLAAAARTDSGLSRLLEERKALLAELDACRNKIAGLDIAIELLTGRAPSERLFAEPVALVAGARQAGVTRFLVGLLDEAGEDGLSAKELTEIAGERGRPLKRQSVSSLLSRLKREGTLIYQDNRYKLVRLPVNQGGDGGIVAALR